LPVPFPFPGVVGVAALPVNGFNTASWKKLGKNPGAEGFQPLALFVSGCLLALLARDTLAA
jgi:hypothetical protein